MLQLKQPRSRSEKRCWAIATGGRRRCPAQNMRSQPRGGSGCGFPGTGSGLLAAPPRMAPAQVAAAAVGAVSPAAAIRHRPRNGASVRVLPVLPGGSSRSISRMTTRCAHWCAAGANAAIYRNDEMAMGVAFLYPEPERGRVEKDAANKGAETASIKLPRVQEARTILIGREAN